MSVMCFDSSEFQRQLDAPRRRVSGPRPADIPVLFVDTEEGIVSFLNDVASLSKEDATVYIDLEGVNLSRKGTISLFQVYIHCLQKIYLLDIFTLDKRAFEISVSAPSGKSLSLKTIIEDDTHYKKALFDLRNDSDALHGLYGIRIRNVEDVQLMAYPTRGSFRGYLPGLAKCIDKDGDLDEETCAEWEEVKYYGKSVFATKQYEKLNERPMDERLVKYCANDVRFLPGLRDKYWAGLSEFEQKMVIFETEHRVNMSQDDLYYGDQNKALGPRWRWEDFGEPGYPPPVKYGNQPSLPYCKADCGRYQGHRHHCEPACKCHDKCRRWWVDRRPPRDGKPAGPKYSAVWGYDRPQTSLLYRLLIPYDQFSLWSESVDAAHLKRATTALRLRMTIGFGRTPEKRGEGPYGGHIIQSTDNASPPGAVSKESCWEDWDFCSEDCTEDWVLIADAPEWPAPPKGYVNVWSDSQRLSRLRSSMGNRGKPGRGASACSVGGL